MRLRSKILIAGIIAVNIAVTTALFMQVRDLNDKLSATSWRMERLSLVDENGVTRIQLQAGDAEHPALLAVFDGAQNMRWLLAAEAGGQAGFSMIANDAPRWSMSLTDKGAAYEMRDAIAPMIAEWPDEAPADTDR